MQLLFFLFYLSGRKPQTYSMYCWFRSSVHAAPESPNSVVNKSISGCSQFLLPLPALSTLRWRRWRTTWRRWLTSCRTWRLSATCSGRRHAASTWSSTMSWVTMRHASSTWTPSAWRTGASRQVPPLFASYLRGVLMKLVNGLLLLYFPHWLLLVVRMHKNTKKVQNACYKSLVVFPITQFVEVFGVSFLFVDICKSASASFRRRWTCSSPTSWSTRYTHNSCSITRQHRRFVFLSVLWILLPHSCRRLWRGGKTRMANHQAAARSLASSLPNKVNDTICSPQTNRRLKANSVNTQTPPFSEFWKFRSGKQGILPQA